MSSLPARPNSERGRAWGGAWPGSSSRPGARAEARDRPRSASRAGGERLEVLGVGSDKGHRGPAAWQGGFLHGEERGRGGGAHGQWGNMAVLFPVPPGRAHWRNRPSEATGGALRCLNPHPPMSPETRSGSESDLSGGWSLLLPLPLTVIRADLGQILAPTGPSLCCGR